MARLGAYYGLCPLIDHRSLLGITQDQESGCVIVTLGKNIAIKFKLSDQKQLCSWSTKDKYSSPIIYDKDQSKYIAVFNDTFVRLWSDDLDSIDNIKKLKFKKKIHTLINVNGKPFIVFKNGAILTLDGALEDRKDCSPDDQINVEHDYIEDILYSVSNNVIYFGLVIRSKGPTAYLLWTTVEENHQIGKFYKIELQRSSVHVTDYKLHRNSFDLNGYLFHVDKGIVNFLSLWSDGRLFLTELKPETQTFGDLFSMIESISCKKHVSMKSLDENYIAMYGCNSNEEGALLTLYSMQFKVIQCKQPFKLFTNGAKIWTINESLLFPVGQNLAVVPFHLDTEQLAALVGSHRIAETNSDPDIMQTMQFVNWGQQVQHGEKSGPEPLEVEIGNFLSQGLSSSTIFEALLGDIFEKNNIEKLRQVLLYFGDVPESGLVQVLKFLLRLEPKAFKDKSLRSDEGFPVNLQPAERAEMLDLVLTKCFNDSLLLLHLRSVLSMDDVVLLLSYIDFMLSEQGCLLPSHTIFETEEKLLKWSCILLDANYQRIVLTKGTEVAKILTSLRDQVSRDLQYREDLEITACLINEIRKGRQIHKKVYMTASDYCIEDFCLY